VLSAIALTTALLIATGCAQAHPGRPLDVQPASALPRPTSSHVVVIVMENEEDTDVLGSPAAPYANALVRRYGTATQSFAIGHPSLPNYLALTSGSTNGVSSDCTDCQVEAPNIVDQLEAAGISWKAYLEDEPTACFRGATAGGYAKKHNPFIYYDDIARSPRRCSQLVGFARLAADLRRGRLPTYAWITPNLCDDGHDCGVAGGDRFLAHAVPPLLRELGPHGFLVLTWDEGSSNQGCCGGAAQGGHIATIVAGPEVRRGAREGQPVDHYGVLGTIEEALGLPPLAGAADPRSGRLTALFARPPHIG
jgi:phosphatidylinositol-3-phosphatase